MTNKVSIQDVVNGTPAGKEAVQRAVEASIKDQNAMSAKAATNPIDDIDRIVGTFIALKYDDDTSEFSDGTLERWNNMKQAIKNLLLEARKQLLDSLIDEEIKLYNIYRDPTISVGIKIMADAVREKYDEI